jgi:hypothetical protein
VEAGDIPHYRIGRLIRFKKEDINLWIEGQRVEAVSPDREAQRILKSLDKPNMDIDKIVKKTIAEVKENEYTSRQGKPDQVKGLREEVSDGAL